MQYVTCGQAQMERWNERFGENLQNGFKHGRNKVLNMIKGAKYEYVRSISVAADPYGPSCG